MSAEDFALVFDDPAALEQRKEAVGKATPFSAPSA